jgi:hypothetical protein
MHARMAQQQNARHPDWTEKAQKASLFALESTCFFFDGRGTGRRC